MTRNVTKAGLLVVAMATVLGASACGGEAGAAAGGTGGTLPAHGKGESVAPFGDGASSGSAPTSRGTVGKLSGIAQTAASPITRHVPWNLDILDQR
ncbi:S8 family peptidase, partial [Streptomyces sp. NPDC023998]